MHTRVHEYKRHAHLLWAPYAPSPTATAPDIPAKRMNHPPVPANLKRCGKAGGAITVA